MVVSRVDKAGRIVIPRELRRALRLEEGDDVELVLSAEGVSLRKVAPEPTIIVEDGLPVISLDNDTVPNDSVLDVIDRGRGA